ncbi:MAG TPA: FHA domain-containing protein [Pyrinomonadaceae bacterium]|nr:FHA domain-containing protein [Pyrinomonadaceae bacterium]
MITCDRCNTENLDGSQYCDECGAALGASARPRKPDTEPTDADERLGSTSLSAPGAGESSGAATSSARSFAESRAAAAHAPGSDSHNTSVRQSGVTSFATHHDAEPPDVGGGDGGAASSSASAAPHERRTAARHPAAESGNQREARRQTESGAISSANNVAHAKLVIHRGRSVGKEFPLSEDEAQIGRWDADGGIFPDVDLDSDDPEAKVSRRHARITRRGGQYFIEDLGSTNGTFINRGRRLLPGDRQPLRDGDEVIVGKTFLRFQVIK